MEILLNNHSYNPNEKVESLYWGVSRQGATVTALVKPDADHNRLVATKEYGEPLERGQGGLVGVLVLGGMETTLDEMRYILEARREKGIVQRKTQGEISQMCKLVADRRNQAILDARRMVKKNPSMRRPQRPKPGLFLPRGYRMVPTKEPGLRMLARG